MRPVMVLPHHLRPMTAAFNIPTPSFPFRRPAPFHRAIQPHRNGRPAAPSWHAAITGQAGFADAGHGAVFVHIRSIAANPDRADDAACCIAQQNAARNGDDPPPNAAARAAKKLGLSAARPCKMREGRPMPNTPHALPSRSRSAGFRYCRTVSSLRHAPQHPALRRSGAERCAAGQRPALRPRFCRLWSGSRPWRMHGSRDQLPDATVDIDRMIPLAVQTDLSVARATLT